MPYTKGANNVSGTPYAGPGSTATNQQANNWETQYDEATQSFEQDLFAPLVLTGGAGSIHGGAPKQLDVTQCTYFAKQASDSTLRRRVVNATNFTTVTPSTIYFLDYNSDGTTSFATSHSADANRIGILSLTTDGSGNINVITDTRPLTINFFPGASGNMQFDTLSVATAGSHNSVGVLKFSAGTSLPGTLDANEIFFLLA